MFKDAIHFRRAETSSTTYLELMQSRLEILNLTAERVDLSFVGDHLVRILIIENANLVSEHSDSSVDLGDISSLRSRTALFTPVDLVNTGGYRNKTDQKTIENRRATSALGMFLISSKPVKQTLCKRTDYRWFRPELKSYAHQILFEIAMPTEAVPEAARSRHTILDKRCAPIVPFLNERFAHIKPV
jgi:hypothetical protein